MKIKFLFILLFMFAFGFGLNAQVLLEENFNYPAGDTIGSHNWTTFSSFVNQITITSPGLTYTNYPLSGVGNACRLRNNGQDAYKDFAPVTSSSLYCSFMINVDSVQATGGDYFFAMLPSTSTTNYTSRFYLKDSLGGVMMGITKGAVASNPIVWATPALLKNTTYLVVVKYKFNATTTTDDELSVFIFTSPNLPSSEPTTPSIGPSTWAVTDATDLGRIALRQGSSAIAPTLTIDGIRVFTSWASILTGINTISELVPSSFALSQNYPNPFNPVTNIRFAIPTSGYVTMKVYNALGKEVSNLVGQNMTAGTYEVKFDGAKLASGMYFYKMSFIADNGKLFADTKKLMLVK